MSRLLFSLLGALVLAAAPARAADGGHHYGNDPSNPNPGLAVGQQDNLTNQTGQVDLSPGAVNTVLDGNNGLHRGQIDDLLNNNTNTDGGVQQDPTAASVLPDPALDLIVNKPPATSLTPVLSDSAPADTTTDPAPATDPPPAKSPPAVPPQTSGGLVNPSDAKAKVVAYADGPGSPTSRRKVSSLDASPSAAPPPDAASLGDNDAMDRPVGAIAGVGSQANPASQSNALLRSADIKMSIRDYPGAIDDSSKALALTPGSAKAYNIRAAADNLTGQYQKAEFDSEASLKFRPNNPAAAENLAWSLLRQKRYRESSLAASQAIEQNPNSAMAYAVRAYANESLGDREAAQRDIAAAALRDDRFKAKAEAARRGEKIYDPDADDASYLLGAISSAAGGAGRWPLAAGAALAAVLGAGLFALGRRGVARRVDLGGAPPGQEPSADGLVAHKYRFEGLIGRGGMGEVYRATDVSLGRSVAVKKMARVLSEAGPQWRDYFLKEARTVAALHHPAIVDIYEIVEEGPDLYLVFEFVGGKTVHHMLAEKGRFPLESAVRILRPVCEALEFAHSRNLVHRDLKPANIMMTDQGHVKLMDFGIARGIAERAPADGTPVVTPKPPEAVFQFDRTNTVAGTPTYMAPEAEEGIITRQMDVFSLGVCLYEMLTGSPPFLMGSRQEKLAKGFERPGARVNGLPAAVDALILSSLEPDPAHRLRSAKEFQDFLEAALASNGSSARV